MAFKKEKETFSAGKKRTNDGAVSARYTKKAAGQAEKKPAGRRAQAQETKKTTDKPAAKRQTAVRTDKTGGKSAADKAAKPAAGKAERTEEKAARPVRRAVVVSDREAERAKEKKARAPGKIRREQKRIEAAMRDRRRAVSRSAGPVVTMIALLTALFVAGALLLCAVRTPGTIDMRAIHLLAMMVCTGMLTTLTLPRMLPIDPLVMALTNFLCGVGIVILYTVSPERGLRQANFYVIGLAAMIVMSLIIAKVRRFKGWTILSMLLGIGALIMPLAFGQWSGGAKNWVSVPFFGSFQPSELVKLSLVLAMAYYFSAHRTVLQMMPAILFAGACLLLLMLQRDLGTALIYYMTTLTMFYVACGNVPLTAVGLAGGAGAAVMGYQMFAHVKVRVAMWRNPWSDPLDKGYQIIQALLAIGSGGLFGVGLGQGTPDKIPLYYNDFIFAVICEQLGLVFGVLLLAVYVLIILRGVTVISRSRRSFDMLLGCGVLAMLAIQTVMIVGGVIKMLPLTGVTMPFISYGGSSLLSCMCMMGVLHGICARAQEDLEEDVLSIKD
ncbi:MAG: FtsW/RodA/SpoVE family cell cycle protein [Clostridia bacterium]|nr:FtsW/RodA/SpoVE family cell cycle protein [Clostridia bacterium]